jgi:hypothetical protein
VLSFSCTFDDDVGGKAPAELPKRKDSRIAVPYEATYYFWVKSK